MAPKLSAAEAKAYVEAMTRIADVLCLASMLPVLFECRFGFRDRARERERKKAEGGEAAAAAAQEEPEVKEGGWPRLPMGVPSVLLCMLAELLGCPSAMLPGAGKGTKGAGKAMAALLEAVQAALNRLKGKRSDPALAAASQKLIYIVTESLQVLEAFDAVHVIVMMAALAAILISLVGHMSLPFLRTLVGPRLPGKAPFLAVAPLALFAVLQRAPLLKAWKALQAEQLLPGLRLPLRVAAAVVATVPGAQGPKVPSFAAMQVASFTAAVSAEIASGQLSIPDLVQKGIWAALSDKVFMMVLVPAMLGVTWLSSVHLRKEINYLTLSAFLSVLSSPVLLVKVWGELAPLLGYPAGEVATGLVASLSLLYVLMGLSIVMAGGTITIISVMLIGNVLVRVHGEEAFSGLLH